VFARCVHSRTVCRVSLILILYSLASYCTKRKDFYQLLIHIYIYIIHLLKFIFARKVLLIWVCMRKTEGRNHLGDPGVDGRIILRWIFRKYDVGVGIESSCLRIGTGGGHL
jgi:hypothetical protein